MFRTDIGASAVDLWGWLFFAGFIFMVMYFVIKLLRPSEDPQFDPEQILIINGQRYKFVKVEDDHNVAS